MQISIEELSSIIKLQQDNTPAVHASTYERDLGTQIIVVDRGFVYVGRVTIDANFAKVTEAKNIRKWGTTKGLGELTTGPTKETVLDTCGELLIPLRAVIHFIKCNWC